MNTIGGKPYEAGWSPAQVPGDLPHGTPARASLLAFVDRVTCLVAWGGPSCWCHMGDLPTSARKVRLRPPWWATRARVVAVVGGSGSLVIADGGGFDVVLEFNGDASELTVEDSFVLPGSDTESASPAADMDRLVHLMAPIGGANNDLTLHRTGTSVVHSVCLQWYRGSDTLS